MLHVRSVTASSQVPRARTPTVPLFFQRSPSLSRVRSSSCEPRPPRWPLARIHAGSSRSAIGRSHGSASASVSRRRFAPLSTSRRRHARFSRRSAGIKIGRRRHTRYAYSVPQTSFQPKHQLQHDDNNDGTNIVLNAGSSDQQIHDQPLAPSTKQDPVAATKCRGDVSPLDLPVIDLHALTSTNSSITDADKAQARSELHDAMIKYGFIYVDNHGVPRELLDQMMALTEEFFDLPQAEKDRVKMDSTKSCRGYLGFGGEKTGKKRDCHESVDLMLEHPLDSDVVLKEGEKLRALLHGPNSWPNLPEALKPTILRYNGHMQELGATIMSALAVANRLPADYFHSTFEESFWTLRMLKYPPLSAHPPLQEGENAEEYGIGCGEHTDYGFLSFVYQDEVTGCLQVKDTEGRWIDANPKPGMFVVNLGDMLRVWSNKMYPSTPHRVQIPRHDTRHSLAYFYEPGFDQVIEPEERLLACGGDETSETNAKSVRFGDHLVSKFKGNFGFLSS